MATISFRNVVKTFDNGKFTVIPDLSLEIKDKEFVVLVGPSGCGKSTTLRMIAGLEDITSGELYIDDKKVNDVPAKNRDIAMVFQSYALYPHMSVYRNMAFALKLRNMPKDEIDKKVRWAARILDIEAYLNRKPRALSGGQRQRVALGRAMVRNPKVFLLDEPLSNLDAKLRTEMRSQISSLHKRLQATFVYVTHDQTEAMTMADRIVVMDKGIVQQSDTPQILYNKPANMFVAGFIGSPQMNFIEADVANENGIKIRFSGYEFEPEKDKKKRLADYVGKKIFLGLRPEHFISVDESFNEKNRCVMKVCPELTEMTGNETNIYFTLAGKQCIARISTNEKTSDCITLAFENSSVYYFDKDSTLVIE